MLPFLGLPTHAQRLPQAPHRHDVDVGTHYSAITTSENDHAAVRALANTIGDVIEVRVAEAGRSFNFKVHRFLLGPMYNAVSALLQTRFTKDVTKNYIQYCVDRAIARNELLADYLRTVYKSDDERHVASNLDVQAEFETASYTLDTQYMQHLMDLLGTVPSIALVNAWEESLPKEGPFYEFVAPFIEYDVPFSSISYTVISAGPQRGRPAREPFDKNDALRVTKRIKTMLRGSKLEITESGRVNLADEVAIAPDGLGFWLDEPPPSESFEKRIERWSKLNDKIARLIEEQMRPATRELLGAA